LECAGGFSGKLYLAASASPFTLFGQFSLAPDGSGSQASFSYHGVEVDGIGLQADAVRDNPDFRLVRRLCRRRPGLTSSHPL